MTTFRPSRFSTYAMPNGMNDKTTSQGISPSFAPIGSLASANTKNIWSNHLPNISNIPSSRDVPGSRGSDEASPSAFGSLPTTADNTPWPSANPWKAAPDQGATRPTSGTTSPNRTRDERSTLPAPNGAGAGPSFFDPTNSNGVIGSARNGFPRNMVDDEGDDVSSAPYSSAYAPNTGYGFEHDGSAPFRQDKRAGQDAAYLGMGIGTNTFVSATTAAAHSRDSSLPSSRQSHNSTMQDVFGLGDRHTQNGLGHVATTQRPPLSSFALPNAIAYNFNNNNNNNNNTHATDSFQDSFRKMNLEDMSGSPPVTLAGATGSTSAAYSSLGSQQPLTHSNQPSQPWMEDATGVDYSDGLPSQFAGATKRNSSERISPLPAAYANVNPAHNPRNFAAPGSDMWTTSRPASRDPKTLPSELERRMLNPYASPNGQVPFYPPHPQFYPANFAPHHLPHGNFDPFMLAASYRQPMHLPGFPGPVSPYMAGGASPRQQQQQQQQREQDPARGMRSMLLEEFKGHKNHGRYTLRDIYDHVVEFSGDQHGSRFIQSKLETANSDEKEVLFKEIGPNAVQLMKDVFGNYVIQKFFAHGNQIQKKVLAGHMKGKMVDLSLQMYSCRVVQKALEHVLVEQQAEMAKELENDVVKVIKDQNGNHVIQKIIELVPRQYVGFIMGAVRGQVSQLASHLYGCRVIQRLLEHGSEQDKLELLEELHTAAQLLITDQYGNYVAQHIIQHGKPEDRSRMINLVMGQLLTLSKHKFASNVVEKCIQNGSEEERKTILGILTDRGSDPSGPLYAMMKDQYGNYVIQKMFLQLKGEEKTAFVDLLVPLISMAKKSNSTRQITALERVIFGPSRNDGSHDHFEHASMAATAAATALSVDVNSAAPTPSLTNGLNSPQSTSPTSVSAGAVAEVHADPAHKLGGGTTAPTGPEVRVQEM
jgi:mRNA-binding protein PUF3